MTQLSNTITASMKILPAGIIMPLSHNTSPGDYLLCDGSAVSRTTYANLFAAIGTTYGIGDGSTTFNVPDLRGVFPRNQGSQTINTLSHSGGSLGTKSRDKTSSSGISTTTTTNTASATVGNYDAAHTHSWNDNYTTWPSSSYSSPFGPTIATAATYTNNETGRTTGNPNVSLNHTHTITTNTISSTTTFTGGAVETSPAYLAVQFVIKV